MNEEKEIIRGSFFNSSIILIVGILLFIISVIACNCFNSGNPLDFSGSDKGGGVFYAIGVMLLIISAVLYYYLGACEICITNKRVYGRAAFRTNVDLPLDSISSVGTIGLFRGITVATSSRSVKFMLVKNHKDIHKEIRKLLIGRQNETKYIAIEQEIPQSNADELKKYKELLDCEVITQEEFEIKKKQLLDL